ncbi:MAG: glycosyltransferase family 4 protein [Candidatus Aenigmatarchaeota archaeon]
MRIMICSDLAPPYIGGGESYVINLASRLVKLGHEVHWLTSKLPNTKGYEIYQGIHIHRTPILFSKHYLFPGRQLFPLTGLISAIKLAKKMDVLQFNTFVAGTFGWFVAKLSKRPCLLWCHEMFGDLWKKIGRNFFEREVYPLVERFIATLPYDWFACPSNYSKETLIKAGAPKERISVIPHGIDFRLFHPNVKSDLRKKMKLENYRLFGYTGRLSIRGVGQSKNIPILLEATKYVIQHLRDARLVLGGSGFEELKPIIKKLGIEKYVIYTGKRPFNEVPKFYAMCDIVVGASVAEGFGFMYAEASRCGKAVVATKAGSIPEIIIDGKTGILVPPRNSKALAKAIINLLIDEKKAKRMGKEGAKYTKKFTWENSVKKHLEVYEKLRLKSL